MRAVAVRKLGDIPELMDLPKPTPGPGEILVRMRAAGVNPFDWKISDGAAMASEPHVFPLILGVDEKGPFIIEGAHRFVALWYLKVREFPAVVVVGEE